eukprot:12409366-Karenia_brevis.AAC.1
MTLGVEKQDFGGRIMMMMMMMGPGTRDQGPGPGPGTGTRDHFFNSHPFSEALLGASLLL